MAHYYERDRERSRSGRRDVNERGILDRAGDEVRAWFGDEEAERRRQEDSLHSHRHSRDYDWDEDRYHKRSFSRADRSFSQNDHFFNLRIREIMNHNVVTVRAGDSIMLAARLMAECDCGAVPVVNRDGVFVGMITDRDIAVRAVAHGDDPRQVRVDECMTDETFACHANDSVDECLRQMARHQIRRLPVVDDDGRVIGIISQGDIARHAGEHTGRGERRAFADTLYKISEPTDKAYR